MIMIYSRCLQTHPNQPVRWLNLALFILFVITFFACKPEKKDGESEITAIQNKNATLIVLNKAGYTAMIIDLATREVVATLPTGVAPHEVDISPDGSVAVASNYGEYDGAAGNTLTVINMSKMEVEREIDLGKYTRPHGLVWFNDGEHIAVTSETNEALLKLHVSSGEIVQVIPTEQQRSHIVLLSSDNTRAYVANVDYGTVSIIDLEAGEVITIIETGEGSEGLAISPDESEMWVTNRYENTISVIDLTNYEVIETFSAGKDPIRAIFTPDGKRVLVSNLEGGDVWVFDAVKHSELQRIDLEPDIEGGARPVGILIPPNGQQVFVSGTATDRIYIIDLESYEIIDRINTGDRPDGTAFTFGRALEKAGE